MTDIQRDLVFIGGGHTHALVIKKLGMKPIKGVRLTLVSEQTLTPYSGMLPGFVAGHYSYLDTHIDLNRLSQWANVRFIRGRVNGVDADSKTISIDSQAPLNYDYLSIDVGSTPDLSIPGASEFAVGVKPVSHFGSTWDSLLKASENDTGNTQSNGDQHWGVVGAGAGGVELVLSMAHRLNAQRRLKFHLTFSSPRVLPGYPDKVVSAAEAALEKCGVTLHPNFRVAEVKRDGLVSIEGRHVTLTKSIWCTGAAAASWLGNTGLEVSEKGFISVNQYLQSKSHNNVFAVGDCADMLFDPRPKAGVYAVRQAPFLTDNLRSICSGNATSLKPLKLQTDFLSLLSLGSKSAVGCRGGVTFSGGWVWKLKDHIDQKFMNKLNDPGEKKSMAASSTDATDEQMQCAGCGSKLGPNIIAGNLNQLNVFENSSVTPALGKAEDASLWQVTPGKLAVQSIDGFRSFSQDYWRFGQICVNHALSDLYAIGATPVSAQVWVNLVHAHPRVQKRDHRLLMASITEALNEQQVTLAGGHSSEGMETHVALVANGEVSAETVLKKDTVREGDALVLTKPLGTGLVLAADMAAKAPAVAIEAAYESMLQSNRDVASVLPDYSASAVTDVTGFGLIGHLLEMLGDSKLIAELNINNIPVFDGAISLAQAGYRSTLYPHLEPYLHQCEVGDHVDAAHLDILLDPQTSGGLLISLPESMANKLVSSNTVARIIGHLSAPHAGKSTTEAGRIRIS